MVLQANEFKIAEDLNIEKMKKWMTIGNDRTNVYCDWFLTKYHSTKSVKYERDVQNASIDQWEKWTQ